MQATAVHPEAGERPISSEVRDSLSYLLRAAEDAGGSDELVTVLLRETAQMLQGPRQHRSTLTGQQANVLIESGVFTEQSLAEAEERVASGELEDAIRRTHLSAITASLSAAEVAQRLGISESRVRHRQAKGLLYAFSAGGKRRYPTWQFVGEGPNQSVIAGLSTVVKALPSDLHAASVNGLMTTPQDSLVVDGRRATIPAWLTLGGDPQAVVDILDSLLQS